LMNDEKIDEFLARIKGAKKVYGKREDEGTTNHNWKQRKEDTDSSILSNLRSKMQRVDAMMRATSPQASQMRGTRARRRLQQVATNFNVAVVH
jgi:outer membrane murein-binding lipoprotein Lpp